MSPVFFRVVLGDNVEMVTAQLDDSLARFFQRLQDDVDAARHIPLKVSYTACKFYQMRNPVSVWMADSNDFEDEDKDEGGSNSADQDNWDDFLAQARQACLEETNRVLVNPRTTKVRSLAERFSAEDIYLAIEFPDLLGASNKAIGKLIKEYDALFKCLQVTVKTPGNWCPEDVQRNLQGGILTSNADDLPPELKKIQEALENKRVYQVDHEQTMDFENARTYETHFDRVFAPGDTDSHTVTSGREFAAFHAVLRCYHEDVPIITREDTPSCLKAGNFTVRFIQPPFLSHSRHFMYDREISWNFPVFVDTRSARNVWRKIIPKSDWAVIASDHKVPFVISQMISQEEKKDRSQMLVEAIALARAGQLLLKSTSKRNFFVVAVYLNAEMVASRYIVMQTGRGADHTNNLYKDKVCIHRKDFKLDNNEEEVDFLREMYNLATQINTLSGDLDQLKKKSLEDIMDVAKEVLSLSSKTAGSTDTGSVTGGSDWDEDEDDLGVFEPKDIQNVLHQMDYKIEFIPWGHPQLAVIVNKTGDKHGYLKFLERDREVDVLRYLAEIESPSNHTISGVRFWPVQGGTVISMPVAGGWLTSLDNPGEQLWSVARQLVEAVAFMHEHNVAHMDLKPQNAIIPPEGGRLSIIDFSVSIRVRGPDVEYSGVVGTEDYMAPEVRKGLYYKPMRADLWSCGRTLKELCSCCDSSADRTTLLEIARKLMDHDPEARPKMSTVLKWMAPA